MDVGQGTLTHYKLAWLQSVNHPDITRNSWKDVDSPNQEQIHDDMFLMDGPTVASSKSMYVDLQVCIHHESAATNAYRRTWRCPPSHPRRHSFAIWCKKLQTRFLPVPIQNVLAMSDYHLKWIEMDREHDLVCSKPLKQSTCIIPCINPAQCGTGRPLMV